MKFESTAAILKGALTTVGKVIERRNTIPVLIAVLFDGKTVRGTDLDIDMTVSVPASKAQGSAAIAHRPLLNLIRHIDGDDTVKIEADDNTATVSFRGGRYDLPCLPASDFPTMEVGDICRTVAVDASFRAALFFTSPFISTEETRYYLNGVCVEPKAIVATDGHRLGHYPLGFDAADFERAIIHTKTVKVLKSLPSPTAIKINKDRNKLTFHVGGVTMVAKLIDGKFPDWPRVVPVAEEKTATISLQRKQTISAMNRILGMSGQRAYVAMSYDAGRVAVSGISRDFGKAREYLEGAELANVLEPRIVGFQANYLRDLLKAFGDDRININVNDAGAPMLVKGESEAFAILMPSRVADDKFASETLTEWRRSEIRRAA